MLFLSSLLLDIFYQPSPSILKDGPYKYNGELLSPMAMPFAYEYDGSNGEPLQSSPLAPF